MKNKIYAAFNYFLKCYSALYFMYFSFGDSLLSVSRQSGSLSAFTDVENMFLLTNNRDTVSLFLKRVMELLNEAIKEIHTLKDR
jgi:hypothetical protein